MSDLRIDPQHPVCMCCRDTGLQYLAMFPPPYRFCVCAAGVARQAAEPNVVDEANARELALAEGAGRVVFPRGDSEGFEEEF